MASLNLNWDVLREIARYADRATCTSLMLTCRFFYREVPKTILSERVQLSHVDRVSKFLQFVQANNGSRYHYMRDISFCISILPSQLLDSLVRSIARMTRLERVRIDFGDAFLNTFPGLADAIAKLTSLRRLHIVHAGSLTRAFLNSLQSRLVSVTLTWIYGFLGNGTDPHLLNNHHPVFLLARWTSTLKKLVCKNWRTSTDVPVFNHSYPKLHTLEMDGGKDFPLVAPYIRAFPNLRRLWVETGHSNSVLGFHASFTERIIRHRERNISSQLDPYEPGTWQHLEEFRGCLVDLYLLGLTSRISSVRLLKDLRAHHLNFLSDVLSYAQPLHLTIKGESELLTHPTCNLNTVLRKSGAARLESLDIAIILLAEDGTCDIISLLHDLASSLSQLPLRKLRLVIASDLLVNFDLTDPPLTSAEKALESFDVDAFVRALGEAIPSLGDAIVEIIRPRESRGRQGVINRPRVDVAAYMDFLPLDKDDY
ncbi:hypothetical protein L227DRAFT_656274 [Lentinus tigrinus ALCF2SS1-6]|uniref:F-box domain-containing protein n=1 Tax=Lentinus tigrinus ALCF2SS1-6 TaxID=1328759 RepID=A0A5C2RZP0_9APHY|nr:hypothetical protein L227DRAFT_656274 [Lentinus tigrinus ALCF2SS1-6]